MGNSTFACFLTQGRYHHGYLCNWRKDAYVRNRLTTPQFPRSAESRSDFHGFHFPGCFKYSSNPFNAWVMWVRYTMPRSLPLMWTPRPFRRSAKCSSLICGISVVFFWALWERVTWSILSVLHCMVTSYKAIKCYKYIYTLWIYNQLYWILYRSI